MKKYIFIIILLLTISYTPYAAIAQVKLETGLPNIPGGQLPAGQELPQYIKYLFIFGLGLITILALGEMTLGGIYYILAAGNSALAADAKDRIFQALIGLGVILFSYLFLRIINPDLVNLRNPGLTPKSFQFPTETVPGTTITPGAPGVNLINCPGPGGGWQCNSTQFCSPDPVIRCIGI